MLIKQVLIELLCFSKPLCVIANTPDHIKYVSLNNQQFMAQSALISLLPNENIEGLRYYPFAVYLDRFTWSCNAS